MAEPFRLTRRQYSDNMILIKKYKDIAKWRKLTKKERVSATEDMAILRDQIRTFRRQSIPKTPEELALLDLAMELDQEAAELEGVLDDQYLKHSRQGVYDDRV